jgi:hypothetical protein
MLNRMICFPKKMATNTGGENDGWLRFSMQTEPILCGESKQELNTIFPFGRLDSY